MPVFSLVVLLLFLKLAFIIYTYSENSKNEFDYAGFSLSPAQEREFIIPFGINEDYININRLNTGETRLVVSLYPNKKMINLH